MPVHMIVLLTIAAIITTVITGLILIYLIDKCSQWWRKYDIPEKARQIAKEHNINLFVTSICRLDGAILECRGQASSRINRLTGQFVRKDVYIHPKGHLKHIVIWHELGHLIHPLGHCQKHTLDNELAANEWAIVHYEGHLPMQIVLHELHTAIMSYIQGGHVKAHERFRPTARLLQIEEHVLWYNDEGLVCG